MLRENHFDKATIFWRNIEVKVVKKILHSGTARLVLDLGCGEGEIARAVFGKQLEWGLDNSTEMVKKAKKSGMYKKVLLADAGKISLKDESVEMVFSNSVLEHIKHLDRVLKEVCRILKPGGRLVFTVPSENLSKYLGWGRLYAKIFNHKYNHYHLYGLSKWKQILRKHGFEVINSKSYLSKEDIRHWHRLLWKGKLFGFPLRGSKDWTSQNDRFEVEMEPSFAGPRQKHGIQAGKRVKVPRLTFAKAKLGRVKGAGLAIVARKVKA
jgi:ubiquinone/menaquinone biosynthesis C-methylase UbiE